MRKRLLLLGTALLLAIPLVLLLQDFTREVFLVELARLYWGAQALFESLPQVPMWVLFLAVIFLVAARSLLVAREPAAEAPAEESEYQGQIQVLTRWIRRADEGEYFKWSLAQHLGELAWQAMAYRDRTTARQLKQQLRAGNLDLPPVVMDYLRSDPGPRFNASTGFLSRLRRRLSHGPARIPDTDLEQVVRFLESQLEIGAEPPTGLPSPIDPSLEV